MEVDIEFKDGHPVACRMGGLDYTPFLKKIPSGLSAHDSMHTLALRLIMDMRAYAMDHEAHLPDNDGDFFHGAALVRTSKDRFFLAPNTQLDHDHTVRNCAESNSLGQSREMRVSGEKVVDLWFTGGGGNFQKKPQQPIRAGHEGRRPKPCGKCLHAMHDDNPHMNVHMLPLLEPAPEYPLMSFRGNEHMMDVREVLTLAIKDLYRYEPILIKDSPGLKAARKAFAYITDKQKTMKVDVSAEMAALRLLERKAGGREAISRIFERANQTMMDIVRQHYNDSDGSLRYADVAILRTQPGNFYLGSHSIGDSTAHPPSAAQSVFIAITTEPFGPVTDLFYLYVDLAALKAVSDGAKDTLRLLPPPGSALERVKKYSAIVPSGGLIQRHEGPSIWMFTPNGVSGFSPKQHVQEKRLIDIIRRPFENPKSQRRNGKHDGAAPNPG